MNPARMIAESLTSDPGIREQNLPEAEGLNSPDRLNAGAHASLPLATAACVGGVATLVSNASGHSTRPVRVEAFVVALNHHEDRTADGTQQREAQVHGGIAHSIGYSPSEERTQRN